MNITKQNHELSLADIVLHKYRSYGVFDKTKKVATSFEVDLLCKSANQIASE